MTYEYKGRGGALGGLGALGWTGAWTTPASSSVARGRACRAPGMSVDGNIICGRSAEEQFLSNQGCRAVALDGEINCATSPGGSPGTFWCCPPGRPGTATSQADPVQQIGVTENDIRELQRWVNTINGCSAGTVDGVWGPNTRNGVECASRATSWGQINGRFPWISTVMATPTGQLLPDDMVFRPGDTPSKPGDVQTGGGSSGGSSSGGGGGGGEDASTRQQEAGFFGSLPWWGWAAIAVGGVAILGVVGVMAFSDDEDEEDDRLPSRSKTAWGDADELSPHWKY